MPILGLCVAIGLVAAVFVIRAAIRRRDDGEEPPDPGDGGTRRQRPPRTPPPEPSVSWPEFERQFAEHVASLRVPQPGPGRRE